MVTEVKKVMVPRTVAKWVPYVTTQYVPRTVTMRIPVDMPEMVYEPATTYYAPIDRAVDSPVGHDGRAGPERTNSGPARRGRTEGQ